MRCIGKRRYSPATGAEVSRVSGVRDTAAIALCPRRAFYYELDAHSTVCTVRVAGSHGRGARFAVANPRD